MKNFVRLVPVFLLALTARAATISTDTFIDFTNQAYDGADLVVTNCTLTVNGPHQFASLQLLNGSRLTHQASDTGLFYTGISTNEQFMLAGTNAVALGLTNVATLSLSVSNVAGTILYTNGIDYTVTTAAGITTLQRTPTSAIGDGDTVTVTYSAVVLLGASGLNLIISGDLLVEPGGAIDVTGLGCNNGFGLGKGGVAGSPRVGSGGGYGGNGGLGASNAPAGVAYGSWLQPIDRGSEGGASDHGLGGSGGGAVKLIVGGTLLVNGSILANGAAAVNERAGGGSGGSVWLSTRMLAGAGLIVANGGDGEPVLGGGGSGGRIAIYAPTDTFAGVIAAHGGRGFQSGGAGTIYTQTGAQPSLALADNAGLSGAATPLQTTQAFALTVRGGAIIAVRSAQSVGSLLVASNGWVTVSNSALSVLGDATIKRGGGITADAMGSRAGTGRGAGKSFNLGTIIVGGGGGYGGGGANALTNLVGGSSYGSSIQPGDPGSGGGNGSGVYPYNAGGAGGGAMVMNIGGTLTVDGSISANGAAGVGEASGGGSGGSILLKVGGFSGSGLISACGGVGNDIGGGGGGGRIALYYPISDFTGAIRATGAGIGTNIAGAGTIYTRMAGQSAGQLLIDNDGARAAASTVIDTLGNDTVIVRGGAQAAASFGPGSSQTLGSLVINDNGWLRLTNLPVTVLGDATIDAGGGIIADGTGYPAGAGTGGGRQFTLTSPTGSVLGYYGGGGGYGGYGGYGNGTSGGSAYGAANIPADFGSGGGGGGNGSYGGPGGGMVRLVVNGTLTLNGRISANGAAAPGVNAGGGAGGAVVLTAGTLAGAGLISANGGTGNGLGGGGGGGRIALNYTFSYFTGTMSAYGGGDASMGSAGTVYSKSTSQSVAQIVIDNAGVPGFNTVPNITIPADLVLRGGAVLSNFTTASPYLNNLLIGSNSWLVFGYPSATTLTVGGNLTIQPGGGIRADGAGSAPASGQGAGRTYSLGYYIGTAAGSGGGYGGYGAGITNGPGGVGYGSAFSSPLPGSGGGNGTPANSGGSGGAALVLRVTGVVVNDGRISADGNPAIPGSQGGGGSGGAVSIAAAALLGAGNISANGGDGGGLGGGGGGGRIFLLPILNSFSGTVTAFGGNGGSRGGAGTVYIAPSQGVGQLIVDNAGLPGTNTFIQDSVGSDLVLRGAGSLVLSSSGNIYRNLSVASNCWIQFGTQSPANTLTVTGSAVIDAGGGVKADGISYSGQGYGRVYTLGSTNVGSGGAYGGYGGAASLGPGGNAFGLAFGPSQPGSGGGLGSGTGLGAGYGAGGAGITIRVSGSLALNGRISANGNSGGVNNIGGGSGGGINISAGTLVGSGTIAANGGDGSGLGGGGGGGRILLQATVNAFSGTLDAHGGDGFGRGGAGTIAFAASPAGGVGLVYVDNDGLAGTNTLLTDTGIYDVTVKGGAKLSLPTFSITPRNIYIGSSASLSLPTNEATMNVSGNLIVESGGSITADGLGYGSGKGPGVGISIYSYARGGGGYGGYGGANVGQGGNVYGSASGPNQLGSGGAAWGNLSPGGSGGGTILLNVTGMLDAEGKISANGLPGSPGAGGGSGGSIWLTAGTLTGSGLISANGGDGLGSGAGGGGGGRIALISGTNLFKGTITAYGGNSYAGGGAGTIYIAPKNFSSPNPPQLIVDNGGRAGTNTGVSALNSSADLIIRNGASLLANNSLSFHNLSIQQNGWLQSAATIPANNVQINISGNATIQAGGGIAANGTGYRPGAGPGAGIIRTASSGTADSGGGYGGAGGSSGTGAPGGASYGSTLNPVGGGSGGGNSSNLPLSGAGGGGLALNVTGTLQLDGSILANGGPGLPPGGGGGSGGTISLTVGRLSGAGLISANGGDGDGLGGGGGGGRIRVVYNTKAFNGLITAYGGGGYAGGGAGTIYTAAGNQASPMLLVDNGGHSGTNTPLSSWALDLTIQNGAIVSATEPFTRWNRLTINSAGTLVPQVQQTNFDLMIASNATIALGGAITVDGLGFTQGLGPGAGISVNSVGSGAGYGGIGGGSSMSAGGPAYGSVQQPMDLGSGGGVGWGVPGPGSEGGGALSLFVGGTLTIDGEVSANGNAAIQDSAGGGSGGSIWIAAPRLAGTGTVSASGGAGELLEGGGGAGGRIAIYTRTNLFSGQAYAAGGFGYFPGHDGSVYAAATLPSLVVVAQNPVGTVTNPVDTVELVFNTPLSVNAVDAANFLLLPPAAAAVRPALVALLDPTHLRLTFYPAATAIGDYTVLVGPNVQDLLGQPMSQVYTGAFSVLLPVIQGRIADLNGAPIAGVVLQPSLAIMPATSDTNGNYSLGVPFNANLTVTPISPSWVFVPGMRAYTNVTGAIANQDYLAVTTIAPALITRPSATNLTLAWFGVPGVTYQPLVSSNLVDWIAYGPALVGTNGVVVLTIPPDGSPQNFFRLRASN